MGYGSGSLGTTFGYPQNDRQYFPGPSLLIVMAMRLYKWMTSRYCGRIQQGMSARLGSETWYQGKIDRLANKGRTDGEGNRRVCETVAAQEPAWTSRTELLLSREGTASAPN
jgi:hypothetical protein